MSRALLVTLALSCAGGTTIVSRWKDPYARPLERGHKLMVIVLSPDDRVRVGAEDAVARALPGVTPSHSVFTVRQLKDRDLVRSRLGADGYYAFAVMRFQGVGTGGAPGVDAGSGHVWAAYETLWSHEPVPSGAFLEVETRIFTAEDGKLVWVGTTDTKDPARLDAVMDEVVRACRNQLIADGLLR